MHTSKQSFFFISETTFRAIHFKEKKGGKTTVNFLYFNWPVRVGCKLHTLRGLDADLSLGDHIKN